MIHLLRSICGSRYAHLCLGLIALYAFSSIVTYTSHLEKVTDILKKYCYSDYMVRTSLFSRDIMEAEYFKEKYRERLSSLGKGYFDYRNKKEIQNFFIKKGLLYDVWEEKKRVSYLLAPILDKGEHRVEIPEKVIFNYFILGDKKIVPFFEYIDGRSGRRFVSVGEKVVYIHRDSIDYLLRWYFDSLWQSDTRTVKGFYNEWKGIKDPLTYFLYRDLKEICEDIFWRRIYRNKGEAKAYFIREGFKVFLPTMFVMGGRMIADQDFNFRSDYKYLRACLTGLHLAPNFTMFYLLKKESLDSFDPLVKRGWKTFGQELSFNDPEEITLDKISKISGQIFEKIKNS